MVGAPPAAGVLAVVVFGAPPDTPPRLLVAFSRLDVPLVVLRLSAPVLEGFSLARTDRSLPVAGASAFGALDAARGVAAWTAAGGGVAVAVVACWTPTPAPTPATITAAPAAALPQPLCR